MKSIALIGMMFVSIGLFAQQSSPAEAPQKEKVCVKNCAAAPVRSEMIKAPIRKVDARKSSVRTGNVNKKPQHFGAHKAHHSHPMIVAPLRKKSAKVDEKM